MSFPPLEKVTGPTGLPGYPDLRGSLRVEERENEMEGRGKGKEGKEGKKETFQNKLCHIILC